jgi:hypoxanthine phosphoribosyltransferase
MATEIQIHDKVFVPFISAEKITQRVTELAAILNSEYGGKRPLLIGILNGSFIFAADLFRRLSIEAEIAFLKLSSYDGMSSTGEVNMTGHLREDIKGRHVIIIEDIVDSGKTMSVFLPWISSKQPASAKLVTFLTKPAALQYDVKADHTAFEIENKFVVGYGLDYNGLGRNLPDLYILKEI